MKSGKGHQEEEEEEDEEFGSKKDAVPSNSNTKDGKKSDRANAMRSKHSVTEQRRRCKINERFQTLRELIPNSDQKRDTASFLLEVIQYVQFLQEKVQKHEGSYQPWSSEPTKLMPWRNSHWRVQPPTETPNKSIGSIPMPMQASVPIPIANIGAFSHSLVAPNSEAQSAECRTAGDALNGQDELTIEGGTISISNIYSQGLLNSLAQALESTGMDLSQATISVQVNLGNRANRGATPGASNAKDHETNQPSNNTEELDQAQKRLKI